MPARPRLTSVPTTQRERAPDLRDAVKATVDQMDWLTPTDQALKTLALRQAEEIEKAVDRAEEAAAILRDSAGDPSIYKRLQKLEAMCEVTKTVGWLGPQLQGVLRDLGGTPAARAAMKKDKPVGSRLAQLRDAAGQHDSA
jgi:precorrin-3B methylase